MVMKSLTSMMIFLTIGCDQQHNEDPPSGDKLKRMHDIQLFLLPSTYASWF